MINSNISEATSPWPPTRLIRAGRTLAGIDQKTLAQRPRVSRKTVVVIKSDASERMDPRRVRALKALADALTESYGIEFLRASKAGGEGVRFGLRMAAKRVP